MAWGQGGLGKDKNPNFHQEAVAGIQMKGDGIARVGVKERSELRGWGTREGYLGSTPSFWLR